MCKKKTTDQFIEDAKKVHGDKYDYSKVFYKHVMQKVCIICPEHGEFWQTPNSHLNGRGCPICKKYRKLSIKVGDVFHSKEYGFYQVIEISDKAMSFVKFLDTGTIKKAYNLHIRSGHVKDDFKPKVFGKGYIGELSKGTNIDKKCYQLWRGMLSRCYEERYHLEQPTYIGCSVCDEWLNITNFKKWFDENYVEGWQIDKDILYKGNKVYSPQTCCFVPGIINSTFTKSNSSRGDYPIGVSYRKDSNRFTSSITIENKHVKLGCYDNPEDAFFAYRQAKETRIKELANKWKDKLKPNVYEALMNYQVEITD